MVSVTWQRQTSSRPEQARSDIVAAVRCAQVCTVAKAPPGALGGSFARDASGAATRRRRLLASDGGDLPRTIPRVASKSAPEASASKHVKVLEYTGHV